MHGPTIMAAVAKNIKIEYKNAPMIGLLCDNMSITYPSAIVEYSAI